MKQFDEWWKSYLIKGIGDKTMQPTAKELFKDYHREGWKAAMEQVLLWGSDDDVLFNKIKDEIYGE